MADKSKIGSLLPMFSFAVERVKIREFLEAIGDNHEVFLRRESASREGYPDIPCPPTFITTAFQEFTGAYFKAFDALGVSLDRVLHGEEEYEYLHEIYPGDVLTCEMRIDSIDEKETRSGSMELITLRSRFFNQNGDEVLKARSLIIERGDAA